MIVSQPLDTEVTSDSQVVDHDDRFVYFRDRYPGLMDRPSKIRRPIEVTMTSIRRYCDARQIW